MNFTDLILSFISGATEGYTGTKNNPGNLKILGNLLIHYDTTIMERTDEGLLLNLTHYSIQTGRLQKMIKGMVPESDYTAVYRIPRDYHGSLAKYTLIWH